MDCGLAPVHYLCNVFFGGTLLKCKGAGLDLFVIQSAFLADSLIFGIVLKKAFIDKTLYSCRCAAARQRFSTHTFANRHSRGIQEALDTHFEEKQNTE